MIEQFGAEHSWVAAILITAAIATALSVIWKLVVKPIVDVGKTVHRLYAKTIEYDDRLQVVETHSRELVNNSGSSLRDAVDRIEDGQAHQSKVHGEHIEWCQSELLRVWQNLASRDAVEAARKTAEILDDREGVR